MREMIQARRLEIAAGTEKHDLFSILVKSSDAEYGAAALSEREMLSNIYVLLLAGACSKRVLIGDTDIRFSGHETTGHTLSTTLLYLALYPEHQATVYQEAVEFLDCASPAYSTLSSLVSFYVFNLRNISHIRDCA